MITVGDLLAILRLRDEMSPALTIAQQNLKQTRASLNDFATAANQLGGRLTAAVTVPIVGIAAASTSLSGQFETITTRMSSLAGVADVDLERVRQRILELAPATGIGPVALADAMMKIASTTTDTKVGLEILEMAAKGAAAGMGDAKAVAGALTAIINSYGSANITAARAADILTQTVKDGGAEAAELAPVLANVVPIAAQLGVSFEEVGANIATLTKLGVPAAEAVTQLASVFTATLKETKQGSEALAEIGMSYDSLRKSIRENGLMETLIQLSETFKGNEEKLTDVFGRIEALRNVMSTAGQQTETYRQVLDNVKNSVGELDKAFEAMNGTQEHTWAQLTAQVQAIAIALGNELAPTLHNLLIAAKPVLEWLVEAVKWFGNLDQSTQTWIIAIVAAVAALGPMLMILGQMATGASALLGVFGAIGGTGLIAAIGTGLVGALNAAGGALGSLVVAFPAATAVVVALTAAVAVGTQAWNLYKESKQRASDAKLQAPIQDRAREIAAQMPGYDPSMSIDQVNGMIAQANMARQAQGRRSGGPVSQGKPYMVGEEGPELFMPGQSGTIVPNGSLGGSRTVVVQSGAVTIQYPIVNDARGLDQLANLLSGKIMKELEYAGARAGG